LLVAPGDQTEAVMAPNGADLVAVAGTGNARDLITFRVGDKQPRPLMRTPGVPEQSPRFSPDGKWIAYAANETGRFEVYVRSSVGDARWPISTDGGAFPLWSRDGRVLYYWRGTQLNAVHVTNTPTFRIVSRQVVFERNPPQGGHTTYDVTPDGTHFVMARAASDSADIVIVLNWVDEWRHAKRQKR
jgi:Tol biopolymer transport system component